MFLIPLNHPESVELVIHALRVAGGTADCSSCPVRKVCMKQCIAIADAVSRMVEDGNLPCLGDVNSLVSHTGSDEPPEKPDPPPSGGRGHLKVLK